MKLKVFATKEEMGKDAALLTARLITEAIEKKGGLKKPEPVPQFVLTYQPSNILS